MEVTFKKDFKIMHIVVPANYTALAMYKEYGTIQLISCSETILTGSEAAYIANKAKRIGKNLFNEFIVKYVRCDKEKLDLLDYNFDVVESFIIKISDFQSLDDGEIYSLESLDIDLNV